MQQSTDEEHPHSAPAHGIPFLAQKLTPPLISLSQVPRENIDLQIQDASGVKLILVRAPAGFGKTTVMVQYHSRLTAQGVACVWLNLDAADNDVGRFIACLAAAFNQIDPAFVVMSDAITDVDGFALDLINRISTTTRRFVLFIDEFEAIQNQTVLDMLRQILHN